MSKIQKKLGYLGLNKKIKILKVNKIQFKDIKKILKNKMVK